MCPDDRLITLVYYHVKRAIHSNMLILNMDHAQLAQACELESLRLPLFPTPKGSRVPESLEPTSLQKQVPHDPRIDLLPEAPMRDNAIAGDIDMNELINDTLAWESEDRPEAYGVVVWSDPWHSDGWEISEQFMLKWSGRGLFKGCWQLLKSTNRWRALRGEEPIVIEL